MTKIYYFKISAIIIALVLTAGCQSVKEVPPVSLEGMKLEVSKRSTIAYKKEGVNFGEYTKVQILPSQVAFKKNWQRDYNRNQATVSTRIKDEDVLKIKLAVAKLFDQVFKEEFSRAGDNPLVEQAGASTLIIKPAIIDLDVNAPDVKSVGRNRVYVSEAGEATLFLELFDGVSGEILARIVDTEIVGDRSYAKWANRISNTADAKLAFRKWAQKLRVKYDQTQTK